MSFKNPRRVPKQVVTDFTTQLIKAIADDPQRAASRGLIAQAKAILIIAERMGWDQIVRELRARMQFNTVVRIPIKGILHADTPLDERHRPGDDHPTEGV